MKLLRVYKSNFEDKVLYVFPMIFIEELPNRSRYYDIHFHDTNKTSPYNIIKHTCNITAIENWMWHHHETSCVPIKGTNE